MYIDQQLKLSDAQDVSGAGATKYSTDIYDQGPIKGGKRNSGVGHPLFFVALLTTGLTSVAGDEELELVLEHSDSENSGFAEVASFGSFASGDDAGTRIVRHLPPVELKRYLRFAYKLTGTASFTAGALDAMITLNPPFNDVYVDNSVITNS